MRAVKESRELIDPPDAERFIRICAARFFATFVQDGERGREPEWRGLHIKRAPVTVDRIVIFVKIRKCSGDEPMQITSTEIGKRIIDIRVRQMNEAIAAKNCIRRRKGVIEQIEFPETYPTVARREQASVTRYYLVNDVSSNIPIKMTIGSAHPTKVAAGQIEQCLYLKSFKRTRQIRMQIRGLFVFGTKSRSRSFGSPQVRLPNFGKERLRSQSREVGSSRRKTKMG
jgi:hypothetical protein